MDSRIQAKRGSGDLGVSRQVPSNTKVSEQLQRFCYILRLNGNQPANFLLQPFLDMTRCRLNRHRIVVDPWMRANPDKGEQDNRT